MKGRITPNSSAQPLKYDISREWRRLLKATPFQSDSVPGWNEKEECAARVIILAITYLKRIGCKNIEQLLKDVIENCGRNVK